VHSAQFFFFGKVQQLKDKLAEVEALTRFTSSETGNAVAGN
jgi:hypothetical protein